MRNVTCYIDINEFKTFEAENTVHGMKSLLLKNPWYAIDFSFMFQLCSAVVFCNLILNGIADTKGFLFTLFFVFVLNYYYVFNLIYRRYYPGLNVVALTIVEKCYFT